ncbi:MAG TPA: DUF6325 family protein [Dehalococcoidia bacterium]|jgi:hypothetical protein
MGIGPVELIMIKFPQEQPTGELAPAIRDLVESGTVRVIDIVFMQKGVDGEVHVTEIADLDDDDFNMFDPIVADVTGMLSEDDIDQVSDMLEDNTSAGLMLFEHTWARGFADAVDRAHGRVVMSERIPRDAVEAALAVGPDGNY